jgi:hypothetical protein
MTKTIKEKDGSLTVNVNAGEAVAYINVEERKLEWAKPITWRTPTIAQMDKIALYTHPADESFDRTASHMAGEYVGYSAKTLTDEEIWKLWVKHLNDDIHVFARAILKKAQEK